MTALMQDQDWYADALCAEIGGDEWFPEKGGSTREAKAVCNGTATRPACPVRDQCLAFALDNDERFGIYGGLSERERRKLKKTGTTNDTTAPPVQEPTMTTTEEQPAPPRSYGQTHIGATGHRPIPTDLTPRPKTPTSPRPTGLDWGKHTAPDTAPASTIAWPCRWCRRPSADLVDDMCPSCRTDAAAQFSPPTVGGVNATPTAVLHSGDTGPKDTQEATFLSVAGDPCAPDQEENTNDEEEWEHVEELPPYILDIAILMRDTEGHADPGVRTARKVVANALVGLNKALIAVPPTPVAEPSFEVFERPPSARGSRPNAPRGPRVDVDQIVRLYEIGCTINAISKELGHSKNTIRHHLIDRGVELRDDRKTHSGGHNRIEAYPDELVADVRRLYLDEQKSQIQVAAALGITAKVVQCVMAKHEIPARPAGRSTQPQTRPGHNGAHAIKARLDALGYTAAQVRAWATEQGLSCPSRGSIPNHLVDQYEAAHTATSQENA